MELEPSTSPLNRVQFCSVTNIDVGAFKLRSHRRLLPFDATRNAGRKRDQYTFFEAFLTVVAGGFADQGMPTVRACELVARLAEQLADSWRVISASAFDLEAGPTGRHIFGGAVTTTSTGQTALCGTVSEVADRLRELQPIIRVSPLINVSLTAKIVIGQLEAGEGLRLSKRFWTDRPKFAALPLHPLYTLPNPAEVYGSPARAALGQPVTRTRSALFALRT